MSFYKNKNVLVAGGMLLTMEKGITQPVNLGSGVGCSIKEIVDLIISNLDYKPEIVWDTSKPSGDSKRLMDSSRAKDLLGWEPLISLEEGINITMEWYGGNKLTTNG